MWKGRDHLILCCILLLVAGLPAPADAQTEVLPRGSFGETIDVRVIDVEVVVTDERGRRVRGLGRDDFRLYAGGREVPIAFFDEVWDGEVTAAGAPTGDGPDGGPDPSTEPLATSYLLFVDDYFSKPRDRNLVLSGLADDLAALGPDDRFAAVAWDGERLNLLTDWTSDDAEIDAAVAAAREGKGWGAFIERRRAQGNPRLAARMLAEQLQRTYAALATALRTFATVDGRRVAVVLSGGWSYELPLDDLLSSELELRRSLLFDTKTPLLRMADLANSTGFTLYPVDVEGSVRAPGGSAAEQFGGPSVDSRFIGDLQELEREESLFRMARRTGGAALVDGQRRTALATVVADTRSFYWLGFQYPRSGDGGLREIRVEVDRPGFTARFRRTFLDLSPQVEAELAAERALLLGTGDGPQLDVRLGEAQRDGRRWQLPFEVTIPLNEVAVIQGEDGLRAGLELRVAVEDGRGDRSEIATIPLDLRLNPRSMLQGEVVYAAAVRLRNRRHVLVFTLSDETTGATLVGRSEFDPKG